MASRGKNPSVRIKSSFDDKGVKKAEGSLGRLNNAGKSAFGGLSKGALGAGAALIGAGGVVEGVHQLIRANAEAEVSQSKMEAQLKALGISYKDHAAHIDAVIQRVSKLSGLDDEDLQDSFTNLVRTTGDVNKALALNADAADLARAKHIDVASAGQILAKVAGGQTNALKRLVGIGVDPVTKAQDRLKETNKKATAEQVAAAKAADKQATIEKALGLIHDKVKGQAAAYGKTSQGSMDRARVAVENLEEKLGKALAPTVKKVADGIAKFADDLSTGHGRAGKMAKAVGDLAHDLRPLKPVLDGLVKGLGFLFDAFSLQIKVIGKVEGAILGLYRTIVDKVLGAFSSMLDAIGSAADAASHLPVIGHKFKGVGDAAHTAADKINGVRDVLKDLDGKTFTTKLTIDQAVKNATDGGGGGFAGVNRPAPPKHKRRKASASASAASAGTPTATAARIPGVAGGISDIAEAVQRHSGLSVTSTTGGTHAPGSFHYKGEAVDLSGSTAQMAEAVDYIMSSGLYRSLAEGIHNPGLSIKNGQVVSPSFWGQSTWNDHRDHVHLAFVGSRAPSMNPLDALKPTGAKKGKTSKPPVVKVPGFSNDVLRTIPVSQGGLQRRLQKTPVDTSLDNPWIQAALEGIDRRVQAGQMTEAQGIAYKTSILQEAIGTGKLTTEDVLNAQNLISSYAPQAPAAPTGVDAVNSILSDIDLSVRAGDMTEAQGVAEKRRILQGAISNPFQYGLDPRNAEGQHGILELRATLGDLKDPITDLTAAVQQQNDLLKQSNEIANRALAISQSETGVLGRALANVVGVGLGSRVGLGALTPTLGIRY